MKPKLLSTIALAALASGAAWAQSAVDAYTVTPVELRGSARFVGMGGAFTSLGGDISCMTQNPAGLGLYRSSDLGLTFDIGIRSYKAATNDGIDKHSETRPKFDNFGYVGVSNLSGALRSFQWGVSYNRLAVMDRLSSGYVNPAPATSLSNYAAYLTNGVNSADMLGGDNYDPYFDSSINWLSTLAFKSFMISNDGSDESYSGLYNKNLGTYGDALFDVRERGYTDEYNIDFAGNVSDVVFWGLGVGIVDMQYTRETNYSESMEAALVYDEPADVLTSGNAGFNLYNYKSIGGSGANLKFGLIVRPVEMLRIGAAIHTPTWMHLSHNGYGVVDYNYTPDGSTATNSGNKDTPDYDYSSRLNSPWRFMIGASVVLGSKAILSADYERVAYNDMKMKYNTYGRFGSEYVEDTAGNQDIKDYYKAANIFRIGAEYRLLPNLSLRAGYNYQSSAVGQKAMDNSIYISTAGTDPSYAFYNDTQNISVGLGYRYRAWYIDLAYLHTRQTGTYRAFTGFEGSPAAPSASLTNTYNNIVISTGIRF
ncbi:MAG: outer membrane protein transport protein [Muribaculaceae bacterium]|nr:outer membrane protein transport protein [Muribaculaceae bacterium]